MSKPFFYRINAADLLADAVEIEDDAERGKWIVRLAMDLVRADFDTAKSSTAKAMIEETEIFRNKKAEAGRKGGSAKAKASSAKANASIPLASSSNRSSTVTEKKEHKPIVGFDTFWDSWPKKSNKKNAEKAFNKLNPGSDLLEILLKAIEDQKKSDQWMKDNGQFIPMAATWINQERWNDELPTGGNNGSNKGHDKFAIKGAGTDWDGGF